MVLQETLHGFNPLFQDYVCGKVSDAVGLKPVPNTALRQPEATQQRFMTNLRTRSQSARMQDQQVDVIENSSNLTSDVKVLGSKTRAVSATRSASMCKWHVTISKKPNFHTSHLPRTCSKKIA
ncbi:hypothetical protein M8C21_010781 [Ambrosia artemisiifolia]|uniref:Uncharacterized protein n=1 Tax=Ambrosia artemisiifolia TaxID=4212 RepID=A0AAD5G2U6_AMBAR|nr:hypothetical protein M8C21_010781 [Ambrosia artemisiifolia]